MVGVANAVGDSNGATYRVCVSDRNWVRAEFGRRLRRAREERDLSQATLAGMVGLNRTSITNIEVGRQGVSIEVLLDLAEILGLSATDLLPETPSPVKPPISEK